MDIAPPVSHGGGEEEEEEGDVCRICRNPGDGDDPLRYPCACKGSIKFVHQNCLLQWLNHSNNRHCEVCKHPFSFSPVYAENAPSKLPIQEFVVGMATKASWIMRFVLRLSFVISVWFFIIPLTTFWIWRLSFTRSFSEGYMFLLSHMSMAFLLPDCLHGFLVSVSSILIFLGATSLRDYIRNLREVGGQDVGNGDVADDEDEESDGEGEIINAGNVAGHLEMQAARLEAQVELMIDGLDDADGAEDVPFEELVGMQGPVFNLVESAFTVLASNVIFLGIGIFIPFTMGRITLHFFSRCFSSTSNPVLLTSTPSTEFHTFLANTSMMNHVLTSVANSTFSNQESNSSGQLSEMLTENVNIQLSENIIEGPLAGALRLSDYGTLAIGYMFIISLVFLFLGIVALFRYTKGEPIGVRGFNGVASVGETALLISRQIMAATKYLTTILKVVILLVFELGVFPLICGWCLDICTVRMFDKSVAQRVEFLSVFPINSTMFHWGVGILFMLLVSGFARLLRGVLHAKALYFLRDPNDPNFNIFRDLIDHPVRKHFRRVVLALAAYISLIVMLVFMPIKLAMRTAPSFFPLDMSVSGAYSELPVDMLLFRILIPFAIEHFKLRVTFTSVLRCWFTRIGRLLGLADFLLPRPEDNLENRNNVEPARNDRLHVQLGGQDRLLAPVDMNQESNRNRFLLRIVLLLVLSWLALLIVIPAVIVVPVLLGRGLFDAITRLPIISHGIKFNDIYAFVVGSFVIWTALAGVRYSVEHIQAIRAMVLLSRIWNWCGIAFKSSALLSIWIIVIPLLIGLLFELLVIVPMRVPVNESPVFLLYQDWAFGLIFLKLWTRMVMALPMVPLVDESWQVKFQRVKEDGFSRLRGFWVLREIVSPIMMKLLTALCVPYVLAKGVFPVFGYPLLVNSAVYRFAWLGCLALSLLVFLARKFHVWFTLLHNSIRDDRYLIGSRLRNFGENVEKIEETHVETPPELQNSNLPEFDPRPLNEHDADLGLRLRHTNQRVM